jgi:hypothetical protein
MMSPSMRMRILASSLIIGHNFVSTSGAHCQEVDLKAFSPKARAAIPTLNNVTMSTLRHSAHISYCGGDFNQCDATVTSFSEH